MEPELNEADQEADVPETQGTPAEQPVTPPFANEGLEGLRDSHC